jgi:replicative DNA helicase
MQEGIHYAKEIEQAIIGQCLLDKDSFGRIYGLLEEKHFYVEDGRKTFSVLHEMYSNSIPIDINTVWEFMLEKKESLKWTVKFGNPTNDPAADIKSYLLNITNAVTFNTTNNLEYYCHLVKKMWKKRELEKLTRAGIDVQGDPTKQGWEINDKINEILSGEVSQDWHSMEDLMFQLLKHQEEIGSGQKELITSGFKGIDRLNGGFAPGQLIVIGARPSVGKSALINKIAFAVALKKQPVGIISLEMDNTQIAARLASIDTNTSFQVVYRNCFRDEDESRIFYNRVAQYTTKYPIYVSDKTKADVLDIKAKAIKLKHKHGLGMLIVDYLQLVDSPTNKNQNREQEVAKISRGLKLIAMDLGIPVIVLCQLNRAVTHRTYKDRLPQLSDLRESGAIEQDADVVMMLHRDWMAGFSENEQGQSTEREADLVCLKWRNGAPFHLQLEFDPPLMKFSEKGSNLIPVTPKDENYF